MVELVRKTANAKLHNVKGRGPTALVTSLFSSATGGTWVGGTIVLTNEALTFEANAMNRAVQKGELDVSFPVDRIIGASITGGIGTKIIEVRLTGDETFEFRCNSAKELLATLDDTLG